MAAGSAAAISTLEVSPTWSTPASSPRARPLDRTDRTTTGSELGDDDDLAGEGRLAIVLDQRRERVPGVAEQRGRGGQLRGQPRDARGFHHRRLAVAGVEVGAQPGEREPIDPSGPIVPSDLHRLRERPDGALNRQRPAVAQVQRPQLQHLSAPAPCYMH